MLAATILCIRQLSSDAPVCGRRSEEVLLDPVGWRTPGVSFSSTNRGADEEGIPTMIDSLARKAALCLLAIGAGCLFDGVVLLQPIWMLLGVFLLQVGMILWKIG